MYSNMSIMHVESNLFLGFWMIFFFPKNTISQ